VKQPSDYEGDAAANAVHIVTSGDSYKAQIGGGAAVTAAEAGRVVRYAGFRRRLAAFAIDCVVAGVLAYSLAVVGALLIGLPSGERFDGVAVTIAAIWICASGLIAPWLYWTLMESSSRQATLGKRALGIMVTDTDGRGVTFVRGTVRYWAKLISFLLLLTGFMLAGLTARKQALHDIISNCLVVVKE
jgi:uncharacterized RDD family membrane protein YckC